MIEREIHPDLTYEEKEYSFKEGVEQVISKINDLFQSGQEYVVVAITGSGTSVGKTTLSSTLSKELLTMGIPCQVASDISLLQEGDAIVLRTLQENLEDKRGVIILGAEMMSGPYRVTKIPMIKSVHDRYLHKTAEKIGLPVNKVDIRVAIYRPDKPFEKIDEEERLLVDVIIRNEQAIDKK